MKYKLSSGAKKILNDPEYIAERDKGFRDLHAVFERKNEYVQAVNGILGKSRANMYADPEMWIIECLEDLAKQATINNKTVFRPLCVEYGPYGVHFPDCLLGAKVYFNEDSQQWYNNYLKNEIGELPECEYKKNPLWILCERAVNCFLEAEVSLPVYGLPTVASVLNAAVNIYGQRILEAMLTNEDETMRDLKIINLMLNDIHAFYRAVLPADILQCVISWNRTQPPGFGQLCGCTTQLLSETHYAKFIAGFDAELLGGYHNGGMIHLCGAHTQHIKTWNAMKQLRSVQLNDRAAKDLGIYFENLRNDQIIYLNPCPEMTIERAVEITGGDRLVIAGELDCAIPVRRRSNVK